MVHLDTQATAAGEGQIAYLAYHDPLTGLSNRTLLGDCLRDALATARMDGTALASSTST